MSNPYVSTILVYGVKSLEGTIGSSQMEEVCYKYIQSRVQSKSYSDSNYTACRLAAV